MNIKVCSPYRCQNISFISRAVCHTKNMRTVIYKQRCHLLHMHTFVRICNNLLHMRMYAYVTYLLRIRRCDICKLTPPHLQDLFKAVPKMVFKLTLKLPSQVSSALPSACDFKSHFYKQCGPRSDCSSRSSLIRVHTVCLYVKIGLKSLQEY